MNALRDPIPEEPHFSDPVRQKLGAKNEPKFCFIALLLLFLQQAGRRDPMFCEAEIGFKNEPENRFKMDVKTAPRRRWGRGPCQVYSLARLSCTCV